jgi:hypothetical protein
VIGNLKTEGVRGGMGDGEKYNQNTKVEEFTPKSRFSGNKRQK